MLKKPVQCFANCGKPIVEIKMKHKHMSHEGFAYASCLCLKT